MSSGRIPHFAHKPFTGLKAALESRKFPLRERKDSDMRSDEEVFKEAMADVREITEFRKLPRAESPKTVPFLCRKDDAIDTLKRIVKGQEKIRISDTAEYMAWVKPRVRKDILEKLHRGDYAVQDSIDLHGMTLAEAEEALFQFFRSSVQRGLFCIKVIHGRGLRSPRGPVLKEALKTFLHRSFSKWILAYATARHSDGGWGATYILLKSR